MTDLSFTENKKLRAKECAAQEMYDALKGIMDAMPRSQDRPPMMSIGQWYSAKAALAKADNP